jgi:hypothetical protein
MDMAREAGLHRQQHNLMSNPIQYRYSYDGYEENLKAFEALVRADEREEGQRWFYAVTAQHKQELLAEREACAKVAEDSDHVVGGRGYHDQLGDADATARNIAAAIRARGQA